MKFGGEGSACQRDGEERVWLKYMYEFLKDKNSSKIKMLFSKELENNWRSHLLPHSALLASEPEDLPVSAPPPQPLCQAYSPGPTCQCIWLLHGIWTQVLLLGQQTLHLLSRLLNPTTLLSKLLKFILFPPLSSMEQLSSFPKTDSLEVRLRVEKRLSQCSSLVGDESKALFLLMIVRISDFKLGRDTQESRSIWTLLELLVSMRGHHLPV